MATILGGLGMAKHFWRVTKKFGGIKSFCGWQIFLGVAKLFFGRDVNFGSQQKNFGGSKNYFSGGKIFWGDIKIFWMGGNKFGGRS